MTLESFIVTILVCFFAGMGAGLGTGFAGMSAAAVITPMLVTFLGIEPYTAVGIALASDVPASAVSAYTYGKNKNLKHNVSRKTHLIFSRYYECDICRKTLDTFKKYQRVFRMMGIDIKFIIQSDLKTLSAAQSNYPFELISDPDAGNLFEHGRISGGRHRSCFGCAGQRHQRV